MKFFPEKKYDIKTTLSKEEIKERIRVNTEKYDFQCPIGFGGKHKEFEGFVGKDDFEISQIGGRRNSAALVCIGKIEDFGKNTLIHVEIRLPKLIRRLSMFFILVCLLFICLILKEWVFDGTPPDSEKIVFLTPAAVGYILPRIAFYGEIGSIQNFLKRVLK